MSVCTILNSFTFKFDIRCEMEPQSSTTRRVSSVDHCIIITLYTSSSSHNYKINFSTNRAILINNFNWEFNKSNVLNCKFLKLAGQSPTSTRLEFGGSAPSAYRSVYELDILLFVYIISIVISNKYSHGSRLYNIL